MAKRPFDLADSRLSDLQDLVSRFHNRPCDLMKKVDLKDSVDLGEHSVPQVEIADPHAEDRLGGERWFSKRFPTWK